MSLPGALGRTDGDVRLIIVTGDERVEQVITYGEDINRVSLSSPPLSTRVAKYTTDVMKGLSRLEFCRSRGIFGGDLLKTHSLLWYYLGLTGRIPVNSQNHNS
ncbi:hypothetical protein Pcinc_001835 [Petrolisthes cinctipes]|uniref:Uncharacterized protein n=1 Tax=Petrolisthes cinctipes TaxID=88211 RepID=A0AAE1GJW3_PETCI|nr:hypothetical protein Pcinc_001835 [Petrolisthes cinctipes]